MLLYIIIFILILDNRRTNIEERSLKNIFKINNTCNNLRHIKKIHFKFRMFANNNISKGAHSYQ